jgi:hypothetical protein
MVAVGQMGTMAVGQVAMAAVGLVDWVAVMGDATAVQFGTASYRLM